MSELPAALPGFYFDTAKNRYFPLSSAAARSIQAPTRQPVVRESKRSKPIKLKQPGESASFTGRTAEELLPRSVLAKIVHSQQNRILSSSQQISQERINLQPAQSAGEATFLAVTPGVQIAGASNGDIYKKPRRASWAHDFEHDWLWEKSLQTKITNLTITRDRYFATSLGPDPWIVITPLESGSAAQSLRVRNFVQEVWAASFTGTSVALGCNGRALYARSVEGITRSMTQIKTKGDVFALQQRNDELFLGTRSGSVRLFDVRLPPATAKEILLAPSAVTNLHAVHDYELLVSAMNGAVDIFDLRFLRSPPSVSAAKPTAVMSLHGHENSYSLGLGCAVSVLHDIVFLAGQDHRIRAWSLRTGQPLKPSDPPTAPPGPFSRTFKNQIKALAIDDEGQCLNLHAIDGYLALSWALGNVGGP